MKKGKVIEGREIKIIVRGVYVILVGVGVYPDSLLVVVADESH